MKHLLYLSLLAVSVTITASMVSCTGNADSQAIQADTIAATDTLQSTPLTAIDNYLTDSIGKRYGSGEVCIPVGIVIAEEASDTTDIRVWGSWEVYNYNVSGDTLVCVSGGHHPGLMHVAKSADGTYRVTAFDAVGDGSSYEPTARKIFGDKYKQFAAIYADNVQRDEVRRVTTADYVKQHNLSVTMIKDYGWDPIALFDSTTTNAQQQ